MNKTSAIVNIKWLKIMRLPDNYQTTITETAIQIFGEKATVWLFGSRLDDNAKGGDVDLLIKLESATSNKAVLGGRYNAQLQMKLGMQKFDVIVIDPSTALEQIHKNALSKGACLAEQLLSIENQSYKDWRHNKL